MPSDKQPTLDYRDKEAAEPAPIEYPPRSLVFYWAVGMGLGFVLAFTALMLTPQYRSPINPFYVACAANGLLAIVLFTVPGYRFVGVGVLTALPVVQLIFEIADPY